MINKLTFRIGLRWYLDICEGIIYKGICASLTCQMKTSAETWILKDQHFWTESLDQNWTFWPNLSFQICNKLRIVNTFLRLDISNSNNLNKLWVGIFTRQGHLTQVQ